MSHPTQPLAGRLAVVTGDGEGGDPRRFLRGKVDDQGGSLGGCAAARSR